jgi:beta-phosphoglucomutase
VSRNGDTLPIGLLGVPEFLGMKKIIKLRPKAIVLDMDGVIVDSMPYHFISWYEALRPLGVRVSAFEVYQREGERWEKSLKGFLRQGGIRPAPSVMKKVFIQRQKIFRRYFKRTLFSGVEEFLRCLKNKGYKLSIVTGTPMPQLKKILPDRIQSLFDTIVTGDLVKKGKPHPDPFLKAAADLGLRPSQCLVIENAPLGIRSAKAAKMFCAAITTSLPKEYLQMADVVVDKLEDITGLIEKSCKL